MQHQPNQTLCFRRPKENALLSQQAYLVYIYYRKVWNPFSKLASKLTW